MVLSRSLRPIRNGTNYSGRPLRKCVDQRFFQAVRTGLLRVPDVESTVPTGILGCQDPAAASTTRRWSRNGRPPFAEASGINAYPGPRLIR